MAWRGITSRQSISKKYLKDQKRYGSLLTNETDHQGGISEFTAGD